MTLVKEKTATLDNATVEETCPSQQSLEGTVWKSNLYNVTFKFKSDNVVEYDYNNGSTATGYWNEDVNTGDFGTQLPNSTVVPDINEVIVGNYNGSLGSGTYWGLDTFTSFSMTKVS